MRLRDEGKRIRMQRALLMELTGTKTTENHEQEHITKQET